MSFQISPWDVFFVWVDNFRKEKFVVVVGQKDKLVYVLHINSEQVGNPNLGVCDTCIDKVHHPFLDYASWVSGSGLNETGRLLYLSSSLFTPKTKKGQIHQVSRERILEGVRECEVVTKRLWILSY